MALIDRLIGSETPKIPVHQFYSALIEWNGGATTRANIVAYFGLSSGDENDLDWLAGKFQASSDKREFADRLHGIFMLAEANYTGYTTQTEIVSIINGIG